MLFFMRLKFAFLMSVVIYNNSEITNDKEASIAFEISKPKSRDLVLISFLENTFISLKYHFEYLFLVKKMRNKSQRNRMAERGK